MRRCHISRDYRCGSIYSAPKQTTISALYQKGIVLLIMSESRLVLLSMTVLGIAPCKDNPRLRPRSGFVDRFIYGKGASRSWGNRDYDN